jgi:hypothetical protein
MSLTASSTRRRFGSNPARNSVNMRAWCEDGGSRGEKKSLSITAVKESWIGKGPFHGEITTPTSSRLKSSAFQLWCYGSCKSKHMFRIASLTEKLAGNCLVHISALAGRFLSDALQLLSITISLHAGLINAFHTLVRSLSLSLSRSTAQIRPLTFSCDWLE